MMKRFSISLSLIVISFIAFPALASPKDDLLQTRKDMEQSRSRKAALAKENRKLVEELRDLQEKLVESASAVQRGEFDLTSSEEKLRLLGEQLKQKEAQLKNRRLDLDELVQLALRLSRTPPEAMVMMPGDLTQTIKAARALKMASDSIRAETEAIARQVSELRQLREKVAQNRTDMDDKKAMLEKYRQALKEKLVQRRDLQTRLQMQEEVEAERLAQLAKKAKDLQELIASLEKQEKANALLELTADGSVPDVQRGKLRSFASARGQVRTPVTGKVVQLYGAKDRSETNKGIVILVRPLAQVTAPYDGQVVFSGPFLTYGPMVILRHSDGFHTLLAGLTRIDAKVGQFLLEGEPIGAMGDRAPQTRLYVELRKDNQPVNPAPWIRGLSKKK